MNGESSPLVSSDELLNKRLLAVRDLKTIGESSTTLRGVGVLLEGGRFEQASGVLKSS